MKFEDHFSGNTVDYARFRPGYPEKLFDILADIAPGRELAWDCACGSGQATAGLTKRFRRVIATDASIAQIDAAATIDGAVFRVAPAEESGIASGTVALVTVAQALHWFDTPPFYAEADRVLAPGGVLAAWTYSLCRVSTAIDALILRLYRDITGPYWPAGRRHIDAHYETLDFPRPRLAMPPMRMTVPWSAADMLGYLGTWSAVQRYIADRGQDPIDAIRSSLEVTWGNRRRSVEWPLVMLATRKPWRAPRRPGHSPAVCVSSI